MTVEASNIHTFRRSKCFPALSEARNTMDNPCILFVDDEPRILEGLKRMLYRQRGMWDLLFANSAAEALQMLESTAVDVLVTDLRMPEMDGAELLERFMELSPDTIRIVLSGYSQQESSIRAAGTAHQFLSKPCDVAVLRETLTRALRLKQQLAHEPLRETVSRITSLPSLPQLYHELCEIARSPTAGILDAAAVVSRDIGMSAKLLQLVNSSFFGLPREIADVRRAVSLMGMETLKLLVLTTGLFRSLTVPRAFPEFSLKAFWHHCAQCGQLASRIVADREGDRRMQENALAAGLLHDLGKLIFALESPDRFERALGLARSEQQTFQQVEMQDEWFSHADVGGYLLGLWRLPMPVVEAVLFHHAPEQSGTESFNATVAVYAANILSQEIHPHRSGNGAVPSFDRELLERLNLSDCLPRWRELAQDMEGEGGDFWT